MCYCEDLKKNNIKYFKKLNSQRKDFNNLNQNFFSNYYLSTYAKRSLQRNEVQLLKKDNNYIGYIWTIPKSKFIYNINSFYASDKYDISEYNNLLNIYKSNLYFNYLCEKNDFNYILLKYLGFNISYGTILMNANISNFKPPNHDKNINFETLEIGKHEELRCKIQNEIFDSPHRIPLTVRDIYFDENQRYYMNNAAIFIKYKERYVGYGQIILENNTPMIVNFGIIQDYRNKGLGRCLLNYLMYIASTYDFKYVYIKVSPDNLNALSLYLNCGFKILKEYNQWYLIT